MTTQDAFTRTITDGDQLNDGYFTSLATLCPIGAIVAWAKTFTGVPALPSGWAECDGSVISDANSLLNGQTLPNLNAGTYRMLRGAATSGGTAGSDTHTHSDGDHNHTSPFNEGAGAGKTEGYGGGAHSHAATSNLPAYYNVVWIMRIY